MSGLTRFYVIFSLLLLLFLLQLSGIDEWLASQIFNLYGDWHWQHAWLLERVLHQGGRYVVIAIIGLMLLVTLLSYWRGWGDELSRRCGAYLCVSTLASIIAVSLLKNFTTLPCPWDLAKFGGSQAPVYLYEVFSDKLAVGHCFPAGHASGGFALFSLFFAAQIWLPNYQSVGRRNLWFLPGLCLGILFGVAQQLRGAHFISHDIASALVCWCMCALIFRLFFAQSGRPFYVPRVLSLRFG